MPNRMLRDWTDSWRVNQLTADEERFFLRLIMRVDNYGRFEADPLFLKSQCFPRKGNIRETDITRWLAACEKAGLIVFYDVQSRKYLSIVEFKQRLRIKTLKYPPPEGLPPKAEPTFDGRWAVRCRTPDGEVVSGREVEEEEELEVEEEVNAGVPPTRTHTDAAVDVQETTPKPKRFIPPSLDEVKGEGLRIMLSADECEKFFHHHEARGWIPKGHNRQMRKWKSALIVWKSNVRNNAFGNQTTAAPDNNPFASLK